MFSATWAITETKVELSQSQTITRSVSTKLQRQISMVCSLCRLIIFFISYIIADYLYCLQSTCIIIVLIHVLIHPYKNKLLNMLDSTILLNMVLIANPTSFQFAKSTTIAVLITNPICCLVCTIMTTTPIKSWILKCKNKDYHELYSATENNQPAVR